MELVMLSKGFRRWWRCLLVFRGDGLSGVSREHVVSARSRRVPAAPPSLHKLFYFC